LPRELAWRHSPVSPTRYPVRYQHAEVAPSPRQSSGTPPRRGSGRSRVVNARQASCPNS
jgi:hypothetical protein